jgi:hypothetical protein
MIAGRESGQHTLSFRAPRRWTAIFDASLTRDRIAPINSQNPTPNKFYNDKSRPEYADFERQAGQERFSLRERAIDVALRAINLRCSWLAVIIAPLDPRSVITREPADF